MKLTAELNKFLKEDVDINNSRIEALIRETIRNQEKEDRKLEPLQL